MRYLLLLFFGLLSGMAVAQSQFIKSDVNVTTKTDIKHAQINGDALNFLKSEIEWTFVSVNMPDEYFHKSFLLNAEGESISTNYMPSGYFRPNNNMIIVTGLSQKPRNSFNPYGATDLTSVVFLTTVNSFISKIRISKRSKIF